MSKHSIDQLLELDRTALPSDGGADFNRLIFSASPYLLQHATNPIDWYPWGEEAFARARAEDRPVLVSIGYSTCHWCHVMASESFEDREVADRLNKSFVAIKIDREERPDLDTTYMTVCQMMTGQGGWPLTILVTPEQQPFFAATYLPKNSRGGMVGMVELLDKVAELWRDQRERLLETCQQVVNALQQIQEERSDRATVDEELFRSAAASYKEQYDPENAGFGAAPKFPAPHNLTLLTRLAWRFGDRSLLEMATGTLEAIRRGGIYDQLGFGLHRYSVDAHWLVPHFEKMLYDQALYTLACLEAERLTEESLFSTAARQTCEYVLRDLQHPDGGFYAGEDADSEGAEGTFYLWSDNQLRRLLSAGEADRAIDLFQVRPGGNFEGKSILHLGRQDDLPEDRDALILKLRRIRDQRPRPHRDEKILTGWNGLMMAALARLHARLDLPEALAAARRTGDFIETNLVRSDGRLLRRFFAGEAGMPAVLEDYACLARGYLELYQADFDIDHLQAALHWATRLVELFDAGDGGLYDTAADDEVVLVRNRSLQDGAFPAGVSIAAGVLVQLGRLTGRDDLEQRATALLERHVAHYRRFPTAYAEALVACDDLLGPSLEATLVCGDDRKGAEEMLAVLRRARHPRLLVLWREEKAEALDRLAPRQREQSALKGRTTAYLCSGRRCLAPVHTAADLRQRLAELMPG